MSRMERSLLVSQLLILFVTISGALKIDNAHDCNQGSQGLLSNVVPKRYDILIHPFMQENRYMGEVAIDVDIVNSDRFSKRPSSKFTILKKFMCSHPTESKYDNCDLDEDNLNRIVMHAGESINVTHISYESLVYKGKSKAERRHVKIISFCRDRWHQVIVLNLEKKLKVGTQGVLRLNFEADIRQDMRGIYKSTYKENGEVKEYLVSQLRPTFARLAFPCFDEPHLRTEVSFKLLVTDGTFVATSYPLTAVRAKSSAESKVDLEEKKFENTAPISIDSFAFTMGEYAISERVTRSGVSVRILTVPSRKDETQFALDTAVKALEWMDDYTAVPYFLRHFTIVAIPDHYEDSTGTLGLATIKDRLTLIDQNTRPDKKLLVAENVIKVVVQQWFGGLVTYGDWLGRWVTEGISAQKTFGILDKLYPQFNSSILARVGIIDQILSLEQNGLKQRTHSHNLARNSGKSLAYSTIEYIRGGVVAQILSNLVGEEKFKAALRTVLTANMFAPVSLDNFLKTLEDVSSRTLSSIAKKWLNFGVYPLITVYENNNKIKVNVQDFNQLAVGDGDNLDWAIPIDVLFSDDQGNQSILSIVLETEIDDIELETPVWYNPSAPGHWLKISTNPDISTYYRIRYDEILFSNIKQAIAKKVMSPIDRLHVLDDSLYLIDARKISIVEFTSLVDAYQEEDDDAVLVLLSNAYELRQILHAASHTNNAVLEHVQKSGGLNTLEEVENIASWKSRLTILDDQVSQGNEQIISQALEVFENNNGIVPVNLQIPVYNAVVKSGTDKQKDKLFAVLQASSSYDQQLQLTHALARLNDFDRLGILWDWMKQSNLKPDVILQVVAVMQKMSEGRIVVSRRSKDVAEWKAKPRPNISMSV